MPCQLPALGLGLPDFPDLQLVAIDADWMVLPDNTLDLPDMNRLCICGLCKPDMNHIR